MKRIPLGHSLSIFLALTFSVCMAWGLIAPANLHMHSAWEPLLPGFSWSWTGYLIGLAWSYAYGWYTALIFVPLYNFFHRRSAQ